MMHRTHLGRLAASALLAAAAALSLSACGSIKPHEAPFHLFNSGMLNEDRLAAFPQSASPERPAEPIAWNDRDGAEAGPDPSEQLAAAPAPKAQPRVKPKAAPKAKATPKVKVAAAPKAKATPKTKTAASPKATPKVAAAPKPAPAPKAKVAAAPKAKVADAPKAKVAPQPEPRVAAAPAQPAQAAILYSPRDAAGYIGAICRVNEVAVEVGDDDNAIAELYAFTQKRGRVYHATRPAVGDLVFFHNTYDRNKDGRNNDWYTHVGIVEDVEDDGTIHFLSYFNGRVEESTLNLEHPTLARNKNTQAVWNTTLRARQADEPPFTQHLASELFAGFGNILGNRTEFDIIDVWSPDTVVSSR